MLLAYICVILAALIVGALFYGHAKFKQLTAKGVQSNDSAEVAQAIERGASARKPTPPTY